MTRFVGTFATLIAAQAAHSMEEYVGRLYESFPPARFVSGLVSADLERGFIIANVALVGFGVWCLLGPVRHHRPSAIAFASLWTGIELVNGIVHPLWSLRQGAYTPGVLTAPILLIVAVLLAREVLAEQRRLPAAT
jgi:hypothetical protein